MLMKLVSGPVFMHVDKHALQAGRPAVAVYCDEGVYLVTSATLVGISHTHTCITPVWEGGPHIITLSNGGAAVPYDATPETHNSWDLYAPQLVALAFERAGIALD